MAWSRRTLGIALGALALLWGAASPAAADDRSFEVTVLVVSQEPGEIDALSGQPCSEALDGYAEALSRCPWLERYPVAISGVVPVLDEASEDNRWLLVSEQGAPVPLAPRFGKAWMLRAVSGDRPITVLGEWDGRVLLPLSAWADGQFVALNETQGAGRLTRVA